MAGSIPVDVLPTDTGSEEVSITAGPRRKIIIDTDVGIDDAQAIFLALADPSVEILAITCVGGNTTLENVCRNVLKVLIVAQRLDIPVYAGCKAPLIGNVRFGEPFHGEDGLGDCPPNVLGVGPVDVSILQTEHATIVLSRFAKKYPGEVSIICLAPLTNLAIAIKIDPDFTRLLKSVYIMGGNHAGEGNDQTASAEFNFYHDPEAASIVLSNCECEVTMLGWETCSAMESRFEYPWIKNNLYTKDTPQGKFIRNISAGFCSGFESNLPGFEQDSGYVLCDEWLMALFLDPKICTRSCVWSTAVELAGALTRGQCVVDKRFYAQKSDDKNKVRHVLALDKERMKDMLIKMTETQSFTKEHVMPSQVKIL